MMGRADCVCGFVNIRILRARHMCEQEQLTFSTTTWHYIIDILYNVCDLKEKGGLGLVNLEVWNSALLSRWLWRFGTEKYCLWREIVIAKNSYYPCALQPNSNVSRNCSNL